MSGVAAAEVLIQTRQLADKVLFPSAMNVDNADRVPPENSEALAAAGLCGLAGPASAGGLDMDLATFCNVIEIMAGGCLATTFVWLQHHGAAGCCPPHQIPRCQPCGVFGSRPAIKEHLIGALTSPRG